MHSHACMLDAAQNLHGLTSAIPALEEHIAGIQRLCSMAQPLKDNPEECERLIGLVIDEHAGLRVAGSDIGANDQPTVGGAGACPLAKTPAPEFSPLHTSCPNLHQSACPKNYNVPYPLIAQTKLGSLFVFTSRCSHRIRHRMAHSR